MKKILFLLLIFLTLCACSGGKSIEPKLSGVTFTAEMTHYNEVYSFSGEILSDGTLKAAVTAPEELKDINFTINDEGTTVEYKGLTYSPVEGSMPFSGIMEELYAPIREIISSGATANSEGLLTGGEGVRAYALTVSPTGLPQKLEIPDESFNIRFYNVSVEDVND